jgi:hypothetical protein
MHQLLSGLEALQVRGCNKGTWMAARESELLERQGVLSETFYGGVYEAKCLI